jgi:hypothetical protein
MFLAVIHPVMAFDQQFVKSVSFFYRNGHLISFLEIPRRPIFQSHRGFALIRSRGTHTLQIFGNSVNSRIQIGVKIYRSFSTAH